MKTMKKELYYFNGDVIKCYYYITFFSMFTLIAPFFLHKILFFTFDYDINLFSLVQVDI